MKFTFVDDYAIFQLEYDGEWFDCYIDIEDIDKLEGLTWYLKWAPTSQSFYVIATKYLGFFKSKISRSETVHLHRLIMGLNVNDGGIVDHKDNNTLDYRKKNLRYASVEENLRNRKGKNSNNTSGHRNVTKMGNWWRVQIQINGKNHIFPEKFSDVDKAGEFAREMRIKYYGNFAGKG